MYEFEKLEIWQRALDLVQEIHQLTKVVPKDDSLGLKGQLGRAALSVALNIAEGRGSGSDREFKRFLKMAVRSIFEVVAGLKVGIKLNIFSEEGCKRVFELCDELGARTNKLVSYLRSRSERQITKDK